MRLSAKYACVQGVDPSVELGLLTKEHRHCFLPQIFGLFEGFRCICYARTDPNLLDFLILALHLARQVC